MNLDVNQINDLNKLVDEYNNTYYRSIGKKPIHADCSAFSEEIETKPKPKFKVDDTVRITKQRLHKKLIKINIFN